MSLSVFFIINLIGCANWSIFDIFIEICRLLTDPHLSKQIIWHFAHFAADVYGKEHEKGSRTRRRKIEEEEANIVTAYLRVGQKVTGIKCSLVINLARYAKMTS